MAARIGIARIGASWKFCGNVEKDTDIRFSLQLQCKTAKNDRLRDVQHHHIGQDDSFTERGDIHVHYIRIMYIFDSILFYSILFYVNRTLMTYPGWEPAEPGSL